MADTSPYPLSRGIQQIIRVNLLQQCWRDTNGFLIHPKIDSAVEANSRIADVATASGLWLAQVATHTHGRKQYELHGFDVSSASFIPEEDLPSGIQLRQLDASRPPPESLKGQYDIVHVRLLQSVVTNNDPQRFIAHCVDLLRPGGYLQWEEHDPSGLTVHERGNATKCLDSLVKLLQTHQPITFVISASHVDLNRAANKANRWIKNLPQHLVDQGMEVITLERKPEISCYHTVMSYLFCQIVEEFANFQAASGNRAESDELYRLVQGSHDEILLGSYTEHIFQTVVARKAE